MKIRLVKGITMKAVPTVKLLAGAEVEARPDVAAAWVQGGYAIPVEEYKKTEKAVLPPVEKRQAKKKGQGHEETGEDILQRGEGTGGMPESDSNQ